MASITWSEEKRLLADLKPYENNPRRVSKDRYEKLVKNIREAGYTNRLVIDTNNIILAGNQRAKALKKLGYTEVNVLVPNVELTEAQRARVNITDNISAGDFDADMLANLFDAETLVDWGVSEAWLQDMVDVDTINGEVEEESKKTKTCPACGEVLL